VQQHANGAVALSGVYVSAEQPRPVLERLAAVTGAQPVDDRLELRGGWLRVMTPEALDRRFPGAGIPSAPCLAGFQLRVADLGHARAVALAGGVPVNDGSDGFWVDARHGGGGVVEFGGQAAGSGILGGS
jgi:hypothetical protein